MGKLHVLTLMFFAVASEGCGGAYYAINAGSASARLEEARTLGAERLAPYEYYYAKANLERAAYEASEASYSDAAAFADAAESYASRAIELSKTSRSAPAR